MTDQLSGSEAGEWLAGFVPEGPLRTLVLAAEGFCGPAAPFIYKYYLGVLAQGAKPEGSIERQDYDKLRAGLEGGNLAVRLYAKWLTAFLDGIERFFGDAGMTDRTLFDGIAKNPGAPEYWWAYALLLSTMIPSLVSPSAAWPLHAVFLAWGGFS